MSLMICMDKRNKEASERFKGEVLSISKGLINMILAVAAIFIMGGCSVMKSGAETLVEVPSLENQANRIIVAMGIIRTNTVISDMPISADASWPQELNDELVFEDNKQIISDALEDDPYVATHEYTDLFQKTQLNGFVLFGAPHIGALSYSALNRVVVLYGPNEDNWPTFFDVETDLSKFHTFQDGKVKQVEASSSNVYSNVNEALISLMPTNFQKELQESHSQMSSAFFEVAALKALKAKKETQIQTNDNPIEDENGVFPNRLSYAEIFDIRQEILELETSISQKQAAADEQESIYTSLLDEAAEVLKSDIELDEEQVALANNIFEVSSAIKQGALEAGAAFALTTTILTGSKIVKHFPKELITLAVARGSIPNRKLKLYDKRIARLIKNALYAIPSIAIGSYYAVKQAFLAERYESIAEIIIETDTLRREEERDGLIDKNNL